MNTCILDFGAKPEKEFLNTAAIQAAIDRCSESGGGRVTVPAGTFLTGSIFFKDNVELHLEHGAVLLGSPDLEDYNALDAYPQNYSYLPEEWLGHHLIIGANIRNAAITGSGTIDGNGRAFIPPRTFDENGLPKGHGTVGWRHGFCRVINHEKLRPGQMVVFAESENILVKDVKFTDSTCWTLFLHGCKDVRISGLVIDNPLWNANTDGIDIDSSKNVVVTDCIISTGDDALTLRGACKRLVDQTKICENIAVSNCVFRTGVCGLRVGVGTGTIRNAVLSNIAVETCSHAIHIQSAYGSAPGKGVEITGLRFENWTVRNAAVPVLIEAGNQYATSAIRDITIANSSFEGFHGLWIIGNDLTRPSNVCLRDVDVTVIPAPEKNYLGHPEAVPEAFLRVENTDGVRFRSLRLRWQTSDPWWKQVTHFENNSDFSMDGETVIPELKGNGK